MTSSLPTAGGVGDGGAAAVADVELALRLADRADELTVRAFRSAELVVDTKPDLTPVTDADRGVEHAIRAVLAADRPADAVVGEEYGPSGTGARRWIIDPIDGTKNFVRGVPVWATLIALEVDGAVAVGVVSAPALGRRWWAGRGAGAFAGPCPSAALGGAMGRVTPIRVSQISSLGDAQISGPGMESWAERPGGAGGLAALVAATWRDRGFGDFWSHMLVAEGACDVGLDPVASLWDLAALQVVVEEAGGRFTDMGGAPGAGGGSALSSNGLVHDAALAVLRSAGA